jgi:uncharacterized RDD family membrane protein YckC
MNCPQCGDVCHCPSEFLVGSDSQATGAEGDGQAWRGELSDRLNRYRARRKARPPRYPSLSLRFDSNDLPPRVNAASELFPPATFETVSNHALALNGMTQESPAAAETDVQYGQHAADAATPAQAPGGQSVARHISPGHAGTGHAGAKIIEFPRFAWGPPAPPPDQLAEPVSGRPRILDVPEVEAPPPALGGITIEAAEREEVQRRPGIDIPLQSAPLGLRVIASSIDGLIVAAASAVFGFIFWKITDLRPPPIQILGLAAGIPFVFWAAYQYLLIVYSASTPGLRVAGLELARFDGRSSTRQMRRWRVLAAWLSAVSLGMGYIWVFLDEDALCWHDRITHTYFAPKTRDAAEPRHST